MESENITRSKAEIDTSAPFSSVKEAVMLFVEKAMAHEQVNANKIKEDVSTISNHQQENTTISELNETKRSLDEARNESTNMSMCLSSLQQELEQTKRELQKLKNRSYVRDIFDSDMEELKFVKSTNISTRCVQGMEFHDKKKYVTHSSPSSMPQPTTYGSDDVGLQRHHPSLKKKKKKAFLPLIGGIFSKKNKGRSYE